jgi:hypothetical protein
MPEDKKVMSKLRSKEQKFQNNTLRCKLKLSNLKSPTMKSMKPFGHSKMHSTKPRMKKLLIESMKD